MAECFSQKFSMTKFSKREAAKGSCSTKSLLRKGYEQNHFWQKDFGQLYLTNNISFTSFGLFRQIFPHSVKFVPIIDYTPQ